MMYVLLTLSITVGILLATGLTMVIMLNPFVMKKYMKWAVKQGIEMTKLMEKEGELY